MGDRGHILRALSATLVAWQAAGCIDFVEPELPDRGAPAVAQLTVVVSDSGALFLTGEVAPGIAASGLRRALLDDGVRAGGLVLPPTDTTLGGGRRYNVRRNVDPALVASVIEIQAPRVSSTAAAPTVRWPGLRRVDANTVARVAAGELRLHVASTGTAAGTAPEIRQWFLTLFGDRGTFRLGADGPPPDTLVIPARWVPEGPFVRVRLIYQQSGRVSGDAQYVGLMVLDVRLHWTVRRVGGTP